MRTNPPRIRIRRSIAATVAGLTLIAAGTPAATAATGMSAPAASVAGPIDSGSSSGSGYLLNGVLNALCAITGERPDCWGDVPG